MESQDLKSLLQKLNGYLVDNLSVATDLGIRNHHRHITMDHLLVTLLQEGKGDIPLILKHFNIDPGRIRRVCQKNINAIHEEHSGNPSLSKMLFELFDKAWFSSSVRHQEKLIRSGSLFEAFIASEWAVSTGLVDILSGINQETLKINFYGIIAGSVEDAVVSIPSAGKEVEQDIPAGESALALYANNVTQQAKQAKIDPILGRDDEILNVIEVLSRRKKSNPILLGEPGVGKTAVVEGLALRIAQEKVPDNLKNVQIHALDIGALQAGTQLRGAFEKRIKAVLDEIAKSAEPVILFIDEAHTLIGAGSTQGGSDAANLLKPALARGELKAIAATTYMEYNKYFAKDAALERRFQPIHVGEPTDDKAILMLRGIKEKYEAHHGIHISDEAVEAAVKLSRKYLSGRQLPDKAVDLLDTAATRVKMALNNKPIALEALLSELHSINLSIQSLEKDFGLGILQSQNSLEELRSKKGKLDQEIEQTEKKWMAELELVNQLIALRKKKLAAPDEEERVKLLVDIQNLSHQVQALQGDRPNVCAEVTANVVAQVLESWTGIPVSNMTQDETLALKNLGDELQKRVVGQDHAIREVVDVIRAAKTGSRLKDEGPIGVFFLLGPSGVGKTELARAAAEALFGDERSMVTLNMTEYTSEHNTSRLVGADPGLVGYGEGGALSEPVRRRPYCVVLLDEMEKAHRVVVNYFMQIFDRGMLKDAEQRMIDFNNTIIFLTSNLASDILFDHYDKGVSDPAKLLEVLRPSLVEKFSPEFVGRVKPIVFLPLNLDVMTQITRLKLNKLACRLQASRGLRVEFAEEVVQQVVQLCTIAETGARNIDAVIDYTITPAISSRLLDLMIDHTVVTNLNITRGEDGTLVYNFS